MAATVQPTTKKRIHFPRTTFPQRKFLFQTWEATGKYQKGLSESPCLSKHLLQVEASFSGRWL
jgi:hypothetical protein